MTSTTTTADGLPCVRHTYADRARHYRGQAAVLRVGGRDADARQLELWARRAEHAHLVHTPLTLDAIVAVAADIERQQRRALTIAESSALKAAYHAACAGAATVAALATELVAHGWPAASALTLITTCTDPPIERSTP